MPIWQRFYLTHYTRRNKNLFTISKIRIAFVYKGYNMLMCSLTSEYDSRPRGLKSQCDSDQGYMSSNYTLPALIGWACLNH